MQIQRFNYVSIVSWSKYFPITSPDFAYSDRDFMLYISSLWLIQIG